jgi:hypothetical protein
VLALQAALETALASIVLYAPPAETSRGCAQGNGRRGLDRRAGVAHVESGLAVNRFVLKKTSVSEPAV